MLPLLVSYQGLSIKLNVFHYTYNKLQKTGVFTGKPNIAPKLAQRFLFRA